MSKGTTQTSTYNVPTWEQADWQGLLGQANGQTNQDIASVNYGQVQNGINQGTQGIMGQQLNGQQLASGITGAGSSSWTAPGTAQGFMSPYENTALQNQVNLNYQTQLAPELSGIQSGAAASGALGGDRDQLLQSQAMNQFNQQQQNVVAQGENTAYNTGLSAYEQEAARNLAGQEAGAQTQLGAAGQNVNANLAATQNRLSGIAASEAPEQQLSSEAGILSALPQQGTQQTTQTPNGGALGGVLGGIMGGAGQLLSGIAAFSKGGIVAGSHKKTRRLKKKKKAKK